MSVIKGQTMSDLVYRDEVIKTICECECYSGDNPCKEGKSCYAVRMIRAIPSADVPTTMTGVIDAIREAEYRGYMKAVEDRPKGEWKAKSFHECFCDNCGFSFDIMKCDFLGNMKHCPNCGARMKGDRP